MRASSWSFLREVVNNRYGDAHDAVIGVSNGGVGPAKLKSLEVEFAGQPVSSALDLRRHCCGLGDAQAVRRQLPNGLLTSVADESVLRPDDENVVLAVHRAADAPDVPIASWRARRRSRFVPVRVSCLLLLGAGRMLVSDLRSTRTTAVAECSAPVHPFDPNGP